MAEWPDNGPGLMQAKAFRKSHPEFKRRHIKSVLQLMPDEVPCGTIIEWKRVSDLTDEEKQVSRRRAYAVDAYLRRSGQEGAQ